MMKFLASLIAFSLLSVANAAEGSYTYDSDSTTLIPPARWSEISATCGLNSQSPIAVNKNSAATCSKPNFVFNGGNCKVQNIVVEPNPGNWGDVSFEGCQGASLKYGAKDYNLKALHLHSKAEHALGPDELSADAELHLVHVNAADPNDLLVIGVFLQVKRGGLLTSILDLIISLTGLPLFSSTQCTAGLAAIFGKIDEATGGPVYTGPPSNAALLNVYDLVPRRGYLTYPGSLTTPPCSETVTWIVAEQLVRITSAQLSQYRNGLADAEGSLASDDGNNNRPLQDLNGRTIEYCPF